MGSSKQLWLGARIQWDERRQWPRTEREDSGPGQIERDRD